MRYLGVDLGTRRVGLALSDEDGVFASPLCVVEPTGDRALLAELARLVRERDVKVVVVGLPVHMDGREGVEAERARTFAARLTAKAACRVELWDERLSTVAAERVVREMGRRKGPVDHIAAALLLQSFLDAQRPSTP